jgi:hypothetical protein
MTNMWNIYSGKERLPNFRSIELSLNKLNKKGRQKYIAISKITSFKLYGNLIIRDSRNSGNPTIKNKVAIIKIFCFFVKLFNFFIVWKNLC